MILYVFISQFWSNFFSSLNNFLSLTLNRFQNPTFRKRIQLSINIFYAAVPWWECWRLTNRQAEGGGSNTAAFRRWLRGDLISHMCASCTLTYPYGGGGYLQVVEPAQGALPVREVGSGQLVEGFQSHRPRRVGATTAAAVGPHGRWLQAQLPFVHKYCQRLLPWW